MISNKQIPVISARAFNNVDGNETPIKFDGHSVTNSGNQIGSFVNKNSTKASELVKTPNLKINL